MIRAWLLVVAIASYAIACSSPTARPTPAAPPPAVVVDAAPAASVAVDAAVDLPSAPEGRPPAPLPERLDVELGKRVDAAIARSIPSLDRLRRDDARAVGVVVMVARDGVIVYRRAAGYADREAGRPMREDTLFRLASMTKPIVAATALALVDREKLALDDPVTKWIPEFRPKYDGREVTITVRQLLTHTSGLSYRFTEKADGPYHQADVSDGLAEPARSMKDNLQRLASVPLVARPGSRWKYGLSMDVLGEVLARAGGEELPVLVANLVTRPLGMIDTTFATSDRVRLAWPYGAGRPPARMTEPYDMTEDGMTVRFSPARIFDSASFPSGGAGLAGTAIDYLRFAEALRTGGAPILAPETARAMISNQVGKERSGRGRGYGFGVGVLLEPPPKKAKLGVGVGTFGWGGIYGTNFWVDPQAKLTVVFLTNHAGPSPLFDDVEAAIYGPGR